MADTKRSKERHQIPAEAALAGILALFADERESRPAEHNAAVEKTEVILFKAGLSYEDITAVTGKNYNAVRMAVTRAMRK